MKRKMNGLVDWDDGQAQELYSADGVEVRAITEWGEDAHGSITIRTENEGLEARHVDVHVLAEGGGSWGRDVYPGEMAHGEVSARAGQAVAVSVYPLSCVETVKRVLA